MNKTVTVNIGGIVFHIDENAYEKFKQYLESIRSHFTTSDGRDEIMQDIEARIAEMFQERVKDSKQVITLEDVNEVTLLMGKPEEFAGSGEREEDEKEKEEPLQQGPVKRRLFRNPDDKLLGGVCSGISGYFDVDPVWIRLAFVLSLVVFGFGIGLYIILWIIIPEAKTAAEKLQMKGEPVTVSNIQKNVKEEMEALRRRMDEISRGGGKKAGTVIGRIFEAIGEVFVFIFRVIGKIIAAFFIFIAIIVLIVLFVSFFAVIKVPGTHYPHMWDHVFVSGAQLFWAYIGAVLLVGIPFFMIGYAAVKMLFNIRKTSRVFGLSALGLWIIGLVICSAIGIKVARQFTEKESIRKEMALIQPVSRKLWLETDEMKNHERDYGNGWKINWDSDDMDLMERDSILMSREVKMDVVKSANDSFQLVEIVYSRGTSKKDAAENATHVGYSFAQTDSLIRFNRFFSLSQNDRYRGQHVQLVLKMPVGARVYFDKSLRHFIYDIENVQNIYDRDMLDRTWKMTDKGLTCVDCTGDESTIGGDHVYINDDDGSEVDIDKNGYHVRSADGDTISIDNNGMVIKDHGNQIIKINRDGMHISTDEKKKKK
jgi:phage shock protein PspC (stress-responsive transcriptional regulator)